MTGIVFFLILLIWFYIAKQIPFLFIAGMQPGKRKLVIYRILCVLCFFAPVADEIIGGLQFKAICQKGTQLVYDVDEVRGKKLLWGGEPSTELNNTILPVEESPRTLIDINTNKHLVDFKEYTATGGWLSRYVAFNSITRPYIFDGSCGAKDKVALLQNKLNIEITFER